MNDKAKLAVNIIVKICLIVSIMFAVWITSQAFYNMLPYTSQGQQILSMLSPTSQKVMFWAVLPLFSSAIFVGLYFLIEKTALRSLSRTMEVFGSAVDTDWHTIMLEIVGIVLAVVKAVLEAIWATYPLSANIGRPIAITLAKVLILVGMYWILYKKHGKEMMPFVFSAFMFPSILVLIFV